MTKTDIVFHYITRSARRKHKFCLLKLSEKTTLICAILAICAFLLLLLNSEQATVSVPHQVKALEVKEEEKQESNEDINRTSLIIKAADNVRNESVKFEETFLQEQKTRIKEAMENYKFHPSLKVRSYEDLLISNGGKPVRSMLITTWRSGSTFLADVLNSHPATFYHYEPLLPYGIKRIWKSPLADAALRDLRKLMNCDYNDMGHYFEFGKKNIFLMNHNSHLWKACKVDRQLCFNPKFISALCQLFPFQNIKTVRLSVELAEEFLKDLSAQILFLVRDPRGTLQSRHHRSWCPDNPDCSSPQRLCKSLVDDYHSASKLIKKYPQSFKVIRYEDTSLDIYNKSRELVNFFHLSYHPRVKSFLDTHTTRHKGGLSSTFRNSKEAPIHWKQDLIWEEAKYIQDICGEALKLWGYEVAHNRTHLKTFNSVGIFVFPPY